MLRLLVPFALLAVMLPGRSQAPDPGAGQPAGAASAKPAAAANSFADEAAVVERDDVVYRYSADGTGAKLETAIVRVQSSAALQSLAVSSFTYSSDSQLLEIVYARVRKPDGAVVETPATDAQDQPAPVTQVAPMYSDLRVKQLPIRSLSVGDKLEFQVRTTQKKAEVPGEFWGQENFGFGAVFLERGIELHVPRQKPLKVYSPDHAPGVTESGDERIYTWTGSQLRPSSALNADLTEGYKAPVAWTTFASWEAVGDWYRQLIAGRDAATPALQAKADELTAHATTGMEKVQAIYTFVSTHNHYIGIDFGSGRYQPHFAAEVLTNQYGDCKDKHTLLAALLQAKGFRVSAVLIGAGIELNEQVPSPAAFNHLITQVDVDGRKVWLDATTEVAPFEALLLTLRDKQALVIPPSGAPQLARTPAQLPFPSVDQFEATSNLDKSGTLKGHIDVSLRSDNEIIMRLTVRQVARTQWDMLSQNFSNASGLSGATSATVMDPVDDTSGPYHIRYDYAQDKYGDWDNHRIGSLLPNVELPSIDEKDPPKKEIDLGAPHTRIAESTIHLPQGYSADLPDATHLKSAFATFDKTYTLKDGSLVAQYKLQTLVAKVPAADWKTYKKFVDDVGQEPWIQLTRTSTGTGDSTMPLAGENNPAAAELVRAAMEAIKTQDFSLAGSKLDEATNLNPRQAYLWSEKAYLAQRREESALAASDYEREMQQHPEETHLYPFLIRAEAQAGRKEEQRTALLAYAKASPDKDSTVLFVGAGLLSSDDVADAVQVYRAGMQALPESRMIQVQLGSALLRAGEPEQAAKIVQTALEGSTDADVLNDGAYVLANGHLDLPLAESSALKAVDLLETETGQIDLTAVNARSFLRAYLLLASWDTLGWIYFAEDKTELAAPLIAAAWRNSASPETGLHFGQVQEKRGELSQALRTYETALAAHKSSVAGPVSRELQDRIDALGKKGITSNDAGPANVLQEQRTFHLPNPEKLKGSATVLTLVPASGAQKIQFADGDDALRALGPAIEHLDLKLALPQQTHALLLRSAILFCSGSSTCDFVLKPTGSAGVK